MRRKMRFFLGMAFVLMFSLQLASGGSADRSKQEGNREGSDYEYTVFA